MKQSDAILAFLHYKYSEKHRFYHTWAHIESMLVEAQRLNLDDHDDFLIALLFHDAVYDPRASDNEQRSADLMREMLQDHVSAETIDRSYALILATANHEVPVDLPSDLYRRCQFLIDLDLLILAGNPNEFEAYEKAIRKEYAFVKENIYRRERTKILRTFLQRPRIYSSNEFSSREFTARFNLEEAIARLAS